MTPFEAVAILLAGVAAGTINTVVGSGTLITFPTLLAFGVPPVTANVSNTIGLVPGSMSGAIGYRRELRGQRSRLLRLAGARCSAASSARCCCLCCRRAFDAIVPALILLGVLLVVAGPRISACGGRPRTRPAAGCPTTAPGGCGRRSCVAGVYGGYFGAAQGVLLMAVLGIGVAETLQRHNATKNVLAAAGQRRRRRWSSSRSPTSTGPSWA